MINFKNISSEIPYLKFLEIYKLAKKSNQKNIEAISIASFSHSSQEVDCRYVNLKFIHNNEFIF